MAIDPTALRSALESLSRDELIELLLQQAERIATLEAQVARLTEALEQRDGVLDAGGSLVVERGRDLHALLLARGPTAM